MDALAAWFTEGGYNIPVTTWPIIDQYVSLDYSFVIVRLSPLTGSSLGTVQTLSIPCGQAAPAIPLTLTSIAAATDMPITAYVASNQRFEPAADWPEVDFDPSSVDPSSPTTDYTAGLQTSLDAGDGRGFRTEFAGAVADMGLAQGTVDAIGGAPYLTRFQTWVSPDEMVSDPEFVPSGIGADDVSNVIDLRSGRAATFGLTAPLLLGLVGVARRRR